MNTSFEKSKNSTDEWYTPKEIIDALGEFDLDHVRLCVRYGDSQGYV